MKTMQDWLDAYAVSHQNKTNKAIHFICVPLIVFSLVGLLMSIPNDILKNISGLNSDTIANWAVVTLVPILFFYLRLSVKMGVLITLFLFLCIFGNAHALCKRANKRTHCSRLTIFFVIFGSSS
ncbi:MAG: DUF962 domain-containing protein, partial [Flavobacteriaceae bacterium]